MSEAFTTNRPSDDEHCRLLIVEDDQDAGKMLTAALLGFGAKIETARNGTEALAVAKAFKPHIVLIDIGLPGLDGYYVARELRKMAQDVLLVAVTGRNAPEDFKCSQEAGCDHHLVKPVNIQHLILLVERLTSQVGCHSDSEVTRPVRSSDDQPAP
jgi:DNA-binding response OmpR family regulator